MFIYTLFVRFGEECSSSFCVTAVEPQEHATIAGVRIAAGIAKCQHLRQTSYGGQDDYDSTTFTLAPEHFLPMPIAQAQSPPKLILSP